MTINSITYSLRKNTGELTLDITPTTGGSLIKEVSILELPYWLGQIEAQSGTLQTVITSDSVIFNMGGQLQGADFTFFQEGALFDSVQPNLLSGTNVFASGGSVLIGNKNQSGANTVITAVHFKLPKAAAVFTDEWDATFTFCVGGAITAVANGAFWDVTIASLTALNTAHAIVLFAAP